MLLLAMIPLLLGIALDFYLIAGVILLDTLLSAVFAIAMVCLCSCLWFLLPYLAIAQRSSRI